MPNLRALAMLSTITLTAAIALEPGAGASTQTPAKDVVVVAPAGLPAEAREAGESMFLHYDYQGDAYLYIEQQHGHRIAIFDVTDPARVKATAFISLKEGRAFDFVRSVNDRVELLRYRDNNELSLLDLRRPTMPVLKMVGLPPGEHYAVVARETVLSETADNEHYTPAVAENYHVIDPSDPDRPVVMATVAQVKYHVDNQYTGTTFLLGDEGLTIVRRRSVEDIYTNHLMQMSGN